MSIHVTADLISPCATPRPDQGPQSFIFPPVASSSKLEAYSEPSTPRVPSIPRVIVSDLPPVQQESEKFLMRKARILRYELEQALEDSAAIKSIQDLHNSHILSMHAIKTEFYDLDGLSWSEPRARYLLDLSRKRPTDGEVSPPTTPISPMCCASTPPSCSCPSFPTRSSTNSESQIAPSSRPIRAPPSRRWNTARPRLVAVHNLNLHKGRGSTTSVINNSKSLMMSGDGKSARAMPDDVAVKTREWRRPDIVVTVRR